MKDWFRDPIFGEINRIMREQRQALQSGGWSHQDLVHKSPGLEMTEIAAQAANPDIADAVNQIVLQNQALMLQEDFMQEALRAVLESRAYLGNNVEQIHDIQSNAIAAIEASNRKRLDEILSPIRLDTLLPNLDGELEELRVALEARKGQVLSNSEFEFVKVLLLERLSIEIDFRDEDEEARYMSDLVRTFVESDEFRKELLDKMREVALIADREPIVAEALAAHQERRCLLSIPALLPQLEGLLIQALQIRAAITFVNDKPVYADEEGNPKLKDDGSGQLVIAFVPGMQGLAEFKQFRQDPLTAGVAKLIVKSIASTRNDILHGRKTDYDDQVLSSKLLLSVLTLVSSLHSSLAPLRDTEA